MLANIYQTQSGLDFVIDTEPSKEIIQFCEYSMASSNPKTVFTAAVVLFNHVLTYKRDFSKINNYLFSAVQKILETIQSLTDLEAIKALLLAETRIIFKN